MSRYNINKDGILVYESVDAEFEYEVWGVGSYYDRTFLIHGHLDQDSNYLAKHGLYAVLINNIWRKFEL